MTLLQVSCKVVFPSEDFIRLTAAWYCTLISLDKLSVHSLLVALEICSETEGGFVTWLASITAVVLAVEMGSKGSLVRGLMGLSVNG
jgi:hypothetical protein